MFTTPAGSRGGNPNISAHSVVYETSDPAHGGWEPVCDFGFGDPSNKTIFEMEGFGDHLYVGTFNLEGYQIWRSTLRRRAALRLREDHRQGRVPRPAEPVRAQHGGRSRARSTSAAASRAAASTRQNKIGPAPPELIRIHPDGSWDLLVGDSRDTPDGRKECLSGYLPGFDNFFNGYYLAPLRARRLALRRHLRVELGARLRQPARLARGVHQHHQPRRSADDPRQPVRASTSIAATTARTGCRSRPTAWTTRTTWACARIVSSPHGLFLGTANPYGPKIMPLGGDRYVPNPRGGCEVHFAPSRRRLAMRTLARPGGGAIARP